MKKRFATIGSVVASLVLLLSCSKLPQDEITDVRDYSFSPGDITLTASPDSVAADGKMHVSITIKVAPNVLRMHKAVTFQITAPGSFTNGSKSIKMELDNNGMAFVYGFGTDQGVSTVTASIDTIVRTLPVYFTLADPFKLVALRDGVAADNSTYADFALVATESNFGTSNTEITLQADAGNFPNNTNHLALQPSANGTTIFHLKHSQPATVSVTATFRGATHQINAHFLPAYPDVLTLEPDSVTMLGMLSNKMRITARLSRMNGTVSDGQIVYFKDSTASSGASIGSFLHATLSTSGSATADYYIQDTSYRGYLYLIGYVVRNAQDTLRERKKVLIR